MAGSPGGLAVTSRKLLADDYRDPEPPPSVTLKGAGIDVADLLALDLPPLDGWGVAPLAGGAS